MSPGAAPSDFEAFGSVFGMSAEAFEQVRDHIPFETWSFQDGVFRFEHEGFVFLEDFLDELVPHLGPEAELKADYVDREAWTITRFRLEGGKLVSREVGLNDVLERYNRD